ncbi:MAG: V-type ATPase subunit [Thaumarchaeota archaeon]|nr:V-type ATPase subunit [Nitrososphaerota archaeon]
MSVTYLICKSHALESRLLSKSFVLELASSNTLGEFLDKLSQTSYGPRLRESRDVWSVEKALGEEFINRLAMLLKISYENARNFLKVFLKRNEIQNLIWIVRMKKRGASKEEIERELLPTWELDGMDLTPLLEAESLDDVLSSLKRAGYEELAKIKDDVLLIEAALKQSYYRQVFESINKLSIADKEDIRKLIGVELDLQNLRTCVGALMQKYSREFVEKFLLENPRGISKRRLLALFSKGNPNLFIEYFPRYAPIIRLAIAGEDWRLELESLKILKKKADLKKIPKYISFFYVIRYLLDLEIEYRNLRSLALAIYHGIPVERRKRLLVL